MGSQKSKLSIVIVGHVDHGKSTLIGRLLHDTDSLPNGKLEELKKFSEKRGMDLEWSFILDAFQAERDQAVTIDTTQIFFKSKTRSYVIIDAPGHKEFLKNMMSGAAQADAAILVVDAIDGIREQTKRHAYLLALLGIKNVVVVLNKMDGVNYDESRFLDVEKQVCDYLQGLKIVPLNIIPAAARHGENLVQKSKHMNWYKGPVLLEALDNIQSSILPTEKSLRFPVQDVYRDEQERRILVGRVESGTVRVGDDILFSPSGRTARVVSIEQWNVNPKPKAAHAGQSIGLILDQPIFVERGDIASHIENAPILSNVFRAQIFWLGDKNLETGQTLRCKLANNEFKVTVQSIESVIDTQDLSSKEQEHIERHHVAEVTFRSQQLLALDVFADFAQTGRCVLFDKYDAVAGGIINMDGYADQRQLLQVKGTNLFAVDHLLDSSTRHYRNGHKGAVMWFTGLSGSGKSTLAMRVEKELFKKGIQVYVLDGDNIRKGLNADLGFSPEDRSENIRRIGEVAALMADAGMVVITAFISPYREDRMRARTASPKSFHEIFIDADLQVCEQRDPKGLYKKARTGEIKEFTGISSPYEAPENPELIIDTANMNVESSVELITHYIINAIKLDDAAIASLNLKKGQS